MSGAIVLLPASRTTSSCSTSSTQRNASEPSSPAFTPRRFRSWVVMACSFSRGGASLGACGAHQGTQVDVARSDG